VENIVVVDNWSPNISEHLALVLDSSSALRCRLIIRQEDYWYKSFSWWCIQRNFVGLAIQIMQHNCTNISCQSIHQIRTTPQNKTIAIIFVFNDQSNKGQLKIDW